MSTQPMPNEANSDTRTVLKSPPSTVSFSSGYLSKADSTFEIVAQDRNLREVTVSGESGSVLYVLESKALFKSWSVRRSLKDASGNHILDLRHYKTKVGSEWRGRGFLFDCTTPMSYLHADYSAVSHFR